MRRIALSVGLERYRFTFWPSLFLMLVDDATTCVTLQWVNVSISIFFLKE
jgi:hypothetical protein